MCFKPLSLLVLNRILSFYNILQSSYTFNHNLNCRTAFQETLRFECHTNATWCSCCNDIARIQGHPLGQPFHQFGNGMEHQIRIGILTNLTVDDALHLQVLWFRNLILRHNPWPNGTEGIEAFSLEPLLMIFLQVSSGHII